MDMSSLSTALAAGVLSCWFLAGITAVIASSTSLRWSVNYDGFIMRITFAFDMLGVFLLMALIVLLALSD
jgi:hypothetical protein